MSGRESHTPKTIWLVDDDASFRELTSELALDAEIAAGSLFLAALVVQIFLAGLGLFAAPDQIQLHREVGWFLHLPLLVILVAALLPFNAVPSSLITLKLALNTLPRLRAAREG